jgi:Spy/CpxP family protein refolding chaperone
LNGVITGGLLGSLLAGGISGYAHITRTSGGWGHGGPGFRGHHHMAEPELAAERAEFMTDWLLKRIDASPEQRQQVKGIVQPAVKDLLQVRQQHQEHRQAWLEALSQPTINRDSLAELRREGMQLMEQATDRLVTALADVAEVLTPEQRARLLEFASRFHH